MKEKKEKKKNVAQDPRVKIKESKTLKVLKSEIESKTIES